MIWWKNLHSMQYVSRRGCSCLFRGSSSSNWKSINIYAYMKQEGKDNAMTYLTSALNRLYADYSIVLLPTCKRLTSKHWYEKGLERSRTVLLHGSTALASGNFSFINCKGEHTIVMVSKGVCMLQNKQSKEWTIATDDYFPLLELLRFC